MITTDLKNFDLPQLERFIETLGVKPFRARQIFSWLYRPGIRDFSQMTDISQQFREILAKQCSISQLTPEATEKSQDGTVKYAFQLMDGQRIESVLIPEEDRFTLCVSSQVGCAMGCAFCKTGTMGFFRNLTAAEIVNQVCAVIEDIDRQYDPSSATLNKVTNLVFMGMGEPLANYDNLITSLRILLDQRGLNFSDRRITVSTCGLIPMINRLGMDSCVNLAISLHSVDHRVRSRLMKINDRYPVEELLAALSRYPLPKRRRIMIEYILLKGINDSEADARLLAKKLANIRCKINLLPYNECPPLPFKRSEPEVIARFQETLRNAGYTVLLRSSRGNDIAAACGQLAAEKNLSQQLNSQT